MNITSGDAMLQAKGVSKLFGQVRALNDIDLVVGPGVTGLLGPNGSGKSTLMKLFAGQLVPDTGSVRLRGQDPFRTPEVLQHLGLCPEQDKFYEDLTGFHFVETLTRLHGKSKREARELTAKAMATVGMAELGKKRIQAMSRGMRQRTKIAQAIAHEPPVILLDEPLTGADPEVRADLIRVVRKLGASGHCVLVSSHVLHEVEAMTHDVIFIRFGRVRAHGDVLRLRAGLKDRPYRVHVEVNDARRVGAALFALPHIRAVNVLDSGVLEATTVDLLSAAHEIPATAQSLGDTVRAFRSPDADLESLYRYLMGKS